jgi:hypothetical protein
VEGLRKLIAHSSARGVVMAVVAVIVAGIVIATFLRRPGPPPEVPLLTPTPVSELAPVAPTAAPPIQLAPSTNALPTDAPLPPIELLVPGTETVPSP